jgi:hypothetical protein
LVYPDRSIDINQRLIRDAPARLKNGCGKGKRRCFRQGKMRLFCEKTTKNDQKRRRKQRVCGPKKRILTAKIANWRFCFDKYLELLEQRVIFGRRAVFTRIIHDN